MAISLEEVMRKHEELFSGNRPVGEALQTFLRWLGENEQSLSVEGTQYFDTILNNFSILASSNAQKMPESPDKRKALRMAASAGGKHITAQGLLQGVAREPLEQDETLTFWSTTLLNTTQVILDLLFDITSRSSEVQHSAVMLGLLYACIDEVTAGHHLARHHYYAQANNHLRTILETLDRIEFFVKYPESVDVWASDDKKRIRKEFKPSKIRERLGKEEFDPIYGYLSEAGTHPTFEMFRGRAVQCATSGSIEARIFVSGTPFEHLRIFHFSISLVVANMILSKVIGLFPHQLNEEECHSLVIKLAQEISQFHEKHFDPWASKNGIDASELLPTFKKFLTDSARPSK